MPDAHQQHDRDRYEGHSKNPNADLVSDGGIGGDASPKMETFELAREMLQAGIPHAEVVEILAQTFAPDALVRLLEEAEARGTEMQGPTIVPYASSPTQQSPPESPEWQDYDEDGWDKAVKGKGLSPDSGDHGVPVPAPFTRTETPMDAPSTSNAEPPVPITEATFIRALRDSDIGSKPYFRKGDILRIIGHRRRAGQHYELLPLKPPGEAGWALRSSLEAADQAAVDKVGEEAGTEEERDVFRRAVEWED